MRADDFRNAGLGSVSINTRIAHDYRVGTDEVMEAPDGAQYEASQNGDGSSPESSKAKLQLPISVDPPGPGNPVKQLVWIVSHASKISFA